MTISQVADAAGVSKMTVTNYFRRKEDLVFDRAEATIRSLAHAVSARAPGESLLKAIRRDCAARIAAGDVTLGPPSATFARIVQNSRVLTSRSLEIADLRERALGDAIAAETGVDDLQQRVVAAQLASVYRVLFAESAGRMLAGESRDAIFEVLAAAAPGAFDLLEPSLGATASGPTRVCQLVLLKLRARLGLRRYPTELLAVADVSDRELRAAESGAPSCTTVEASARPWGRQCFPIRQLAVALVMTVSSLFRVLVRSPICPLIRSLSAESRSSSSGVARPFTTHGSKSRIDLLGSPAAYNCWISWTRSTALSGKWRWPLRLRSGASRPCCS